LLRRADSGVYRRAQLQTNQLPEKVKNKARRLEMGAAGLSEFGAPLLGNVARGAFCITQSANSND
jgi:hypothetical protein